MWRFWATVGLGFGVTAAACSKVETPPDTGPACGAWFDAQARYEARCGVPQTIAERQALARSRFVDACNLQLAAPGTSKTIASVNACVQSLETRSCDANAQPAPSADPCADAPGTMREGAVCYRDDQCRSTFCRKGRALPDAGARVATLCGTCAAALGEGEACGDGDRCAGDMKCVHGQCSALVLESLGAPCADPFNPCKPGGVCKDFVCVKAGAAGDACASDSDCDVALACLPGPATAPEKKCASRPSEGGDCTAPGQCARGLGCNPDSKKCEKPKIVRFPDACDVESRVCEIGTCALGADGLKGQCPSILPDGAACDPANRSAVCDDYATCLDGTCQIFEPSLCR